jgi:acetyl esterase/lipase
MQVKEFRKDRLGKLARINNKKTTAMKITQYPLNPQLHSKYLKVAILGFLMTKTWGVRLLTFLTRLSNGKNIDGLDCSEQYIPSTSGGPDIRFRILKPQYVDGPLPCLLFIHGGGYMIGNPEATFNSIKQFIDTRACIAIAPDYRKSVKAPYPAAFNDCYDTLIWIRDNAAQLGIRADQIIVGGPSAGGGLTTALSLKARDTGDVKIAFQMPLYPMIDDRQNTESAITMTLYPWNARLNKKGWNLYLAGLNKTHAAIPSYAAPARNTDYTGFPPTITFVGELEPFRDETIDYTEALKAAGIPVVFELFKGCFHGFDLIAPNAEISKKANRFLLEAYSQYYDQCFKND